MCCQQAYAHPTISSHTLALQLYWPCSCLPTLGFVFKGGDLWARRYAMGGRNIQTPSGIFRGLPQQATVCALPDAHVSANILQNFFAILCFGARVYELFLSFISLRESGYRL